MKNKISRRQLAKFGGLFLLGSVAAKLPAEIQVKKIEDWAPVPNFYNGQRLTAEPLEALTTTIIQLQNEVEKLRGKN